MKKHKIPNYKIKRLILFAEHLQKCKFEDYPMELYCPSNLPPFTVTNQGISFTCYPFIYLELPNVFPAEWEYLTDCGLTVYLSGNHPTIEKALADFFGLSTKQILYCFVPYVKFKYFFSKPLHSCSTPKDVADGIYAMLNSIIPNFSKRMVLIEKIRP